MKQKTPWPGRMRLRLLLPLSGVLILPGCAQIVVTQDQDGNNVSVELKRPSLNPVGQAPQISAQSQSIEQMEEATRRRINQIRQQKGLKPLQMHGRLRKIARDYSRRMAKENFFSHYDSKGRGADARVRAAGIRYSMVGENLAMSRGARNPIDTVVDGWMKSKGHRENLLRENYSLTGLGIWKEGNSYWFTQVFLRPS